MNVHRDGHDMGEPRKMEAGSRFDDLLEIMSDGGEVVITREGKSVARVVPLSANRQQAEAVAAIDRIRARARNRSFPRTEAAVWRDLRDEGRP